MSPFGKISFCGKLYNQMTAIRGKLGIVVCSSSKKQECCLCFYSGLVESTLLLLFDVLSCVFPLPVYLCCDMLVLVWTHQGWAGAATLFHTLALFLEILQDSNLALVNMFEYMFEVVLCCPTLRSRSKWACLLYKKGEFSSYSLVVHQIVPTQQQKRPHSLEEAF